MGDVIQLHGFERPRPPEHMIDIEGVLLGDRYSFAPAPELEQWLRQVFLDASGPLHNAEHEHLQQAKIGCIWTGVANSRHGRRIAGQCELGESIGGNGGKWVKGRARQQLGEWFGCLPDFVLTFYAPHAAECDDAQFCGLVEHELYHASQAKDDYGAPKFRKDGSPVWAIRGHDVEEFVGVVARYGVDAAANVEALVAVANKGPLIGPSRLAHVCGTCQRVAA